MALVNVMDRAKKMRLIVWKRLQDRQWLVHDPSLDGYFQFEFNEESLSDFRFLSGRTTTVGNPFEFKIPEVTIQATLAKLKELPNVRRKKNIEARCNQANARTLTASGVAEILNFLAGKSVSGSGIGGFQDLAVRIRTSEIAEPQWFPLKFDSTNLEDAERHASDESDEDWLNHFMKLKTNSSKKNPKGKTTTPGLRPQPDEELNVSLQVFSHPLNLLLEGVPGTGKTFAIQSIVKKLCKRHGPENHDCCIAGEGLGPFAITMHPATSYEEFVEGLRPVPQSMVDAKESGGGHSEPVRPKPKVEGCSGDIDKHSKWFWDPCSCESLTFSIADGFFVRVCAAAAGEGNKLFVVLLDEFNRCNVPKVMGDLLTTLEPSKRARWNRETEKWDLTEAQIVTLPGSGRLFFVPDNVFVVATMNSSDRSVGSLDAALRRRFAVERLWPLGFDPGEKSTADEVEALILKGGRSKPLVLDGDAQELFKKSVVAWFELNMALKAALGPDGMLGHSYLFDLAKGLSSKGSDRRWPWAGNPTNTVAQVWNQQILPQLAETLESTHMPDDKVSGLLDKANAEFSKLGGAIASGEKLERRSLLSKVALWLTLKEPNKLPDNPQKDESPDNQSVGDKKNLKVQNLPTDGGPES